MSILTKVLKLFCYDPETDGANTFNIPKALNENWEKIDQLVLLAVAVAAAYDPEGSYAVGDYCTHGGKLHKCNTPIPSGETWNAAHWTETTVAAELAGKANATPPQEHAIVPKNGATLLDGFKNSYSKDQFGRVVAFFSLYFESVPENTIEIFSLPQSFAPTGETVVGAAVLSMSVYFPALVTAYTNGMVTVGHNVTGYSGPINLHGFLVIDTGGTK